MSINAIGILVSVLALWTAGALVVVLLLRRADKRKPTVRVGEDIGPAARPLPTLARANLKAMAIANASVARGSSPLSHILSGPLEKASDRKVSRAVPNLANEVERLNLHVLYPELVGADVWITGSRVWRITLGEFAPATADIDVFTTSPEAYTKLTLELAKRGGSITQRPAENRSHARGYGVRIEVPSKFANAPSIWFDVWHECTDPYHQLRLYPADGYAHCRAAYNALNRILILMTNEQAP